MSFKVTNISTMKFAKKISTENLTFPINPFYILLQSISYFCNSVLWAKNGKMVQSRTLLLFLKNTNALHQ